VLPFRDRPGSLNTASRKTGYNRAISGNKPNSYPARMSSHRVTLSAFGTTGVLVAASLTMLAMVSALVTFDGWPRGYGTSSVGTVPVSRVPVPHLVKAVHQHAGTAAGQSQAARSASLARAARLRGQGGARPAGTGGRGPRYPAANFTPSVGGNPPGEDPGGPPRIIQPPPHSDGGPVPPVVHQTACAAQGTVGGVSRGAGQAVAAACNGPN